jgi:hypothetical protein
MCELEVLNSNLGQDTGYPEVLYDFPQFLQANDKTVSELGQGHFFLNPFKSIVL